MVVQWNEATTRLLIKEYCNHKEQFESSQTNKKPLWIAIKKVFNDYGYSYSVDSTENKWKSLLRTFKNAKHCKSQTGTAHTKFPCYEMLQIVGQPHDVIP